MDNAFRNFLDRHRAEIVGQTWKPRALLEASTLQRLWLSAQHLYLDIASLPLETLSTGGSASVARLNRMNVALLVAKRSRSVDCVVFFSALADAFRQGGVIIQMIRRAELSGDTGRE